MAKYTDKEMDRIISAGKKSYASMSNKGQPGGMSSVPSQGKRDAFVNLQRQKFFGDRDIPEERVLRRTRQEGGVRQFKDALIRNDRVLKGTRPDGSTYTVMNPNTGEPVYLTDVPGGRSVGDVSRDFAYRFGPTPSEVLGDIGYGIRSIGSALGQKVAASEFGFMGLAKSLYEQFTNSAAKAKDALVKGVNKLSDIDLEVLKKKDTGEYKFLSKKAEIQEVENLEKTQMTEFDKANIIRQGIEQLETTPITGTTTLPQQPPGFKVMPTGPSTSYLPGQFGFPGQFGATPVPNNIQQAQNPNELRRALMENTMPNNFPQEKPYLMQQDDYYYQDKERFSPQGNQYLYAAEGGSVDNKLNDIQKKTNNIYGTGILSVR
jgi:hypothetical protein